MPKVPFWVFIVIALLYLTAIRIDTMDVDASQYAEISREMMVRGDYLHVYDRGYDYLDKPPFLFWASATSMRLFGVNNFGYKFPSLLFALWGLFATYRLARLLYNEETGRIAALVLATCQGMFLMTNDIRCDTILMSCVITAIWLIREWYARYRIQYLLGGAAFIGLGMLTKGPIALMVPVFGLGTDWALKREWRKFFRPEYLLALIVIGLILVPMSIGLYQQFDLHPEKSVNGVTGLSGLRFFYWTQSFGRITGESPWKNDVDVTFLLQNMLWSFLPWIFVFLPALVINIGQLIRQRFRLKPEQEWISTGGFLLSYLVLGLSAYQLPHYIFVAFPLAAIVTGKLLSDLVAEQRYQKLFLVLSPVVCSIVFLVLAVAGVLVIYVFPAHWTIITSWAAGLIFWGWLAMKKGMPGKLIWLPAMGMILVNIFVTNHMYATLLRYQVGSQAGRFIHETAIPPADVAIYKVNDPLNSLDFYGHGGLPHIITGLNELKLPQHVLTTDEGINDIRAKGMRFDILHQGEFFKVSELTPEFLDPKTRGKAVTAYYLLKVQ